MLRRPRPVTGAGEVLEQAGRLGDHRAGDLVEHESHLLLGPGSGSHLDHVSQGARVGGPQDVGRQTGRCQPPQRGGDLLLDVEGHSLLVDPELLGGVALELLELLDDRQHPLAHRLERGGDAEADVGQAHVAQALLAEGRPGAVADELVGEDAADVAQHERVVGVLEHAPVGGAQDVREVLPLVGAHLRDVGVQPRLPAAVAGPPSELDQQLAGVRGLVALPVRRCSHDSPPTSRRYPAIASRSIEGLAIRNTSGRVSCIGRRILPSFPVAHGSSPGALPERPAGRVLAAEGGLGTRRRLGSRGPPRALALVARQPEGAEHDQARDRSDRDDLVQRVGAVGASGLPRQSGVVAGFVDAFEARVVDPQQPRRQRREQRPGEQHEHAPTRARGRQPHPSGGDRREHQPGGGREQEHPDPVPPATEAVGGGDRGLQQTLVEEPLPDHGLGLIAHQRMGDRGDHRQRDRGAGEGEGGSGEALQREPQRARQERDHRREEAGAHEASPEGQEVARVVGHVAEADAADRERLGPAPPPVQQHGPDRAHDQHRGDRQQSPRVEQQRGQDPQARGGDPEEAFFLALDVFVGEVRPGVEGEVVVQQQRDDPDHAAEDVGARAREDAPHVERVAATEQEQPEHHRHQEHGVLGSDRIADRQSRQPQQQQARRPVPLAQHQPEGGKTEEGSEHVAEQQRRERQHERPRPTTTADKKDQRIKGRHMAN